MNRTLLTLLVVVALATAAFTQSSFKIFVKPSTGYVLDKAALLSPAIVSKVNAISASSDSSHESPIYVVTIPSLASVGAHNVESYATTLFNAWQIGSRTTNKGILLLVAKADRKARIELGAGWDSSADGQSSEIMSSAIVSKFKTGDFPGGILAGVQALSEMAANPPTEAQPYYPESGYSYEAVPASSDSGILMLLCPGAFILMLIAVAVANKGGGGGWSSGDSWNDRHRHYGGSTFRSSGSSFISSSRSSGGSSSRSSGGHSSGGGSTGSW